MKEILNGRKSSSQSQPPAVLEPREGDFDLPAPLYTVLKGLRGVSERTLRMYPGTLRLRCYRPGKRTEVICEQGAQGWTAFAILSADDLRALHAERDKLLKELPAKIKAAEAKKPDDAEAGRALLAELQAARLPPLLPPQTGPAATVYLDSSRTTAPPRPGWLSRLFGGRRPQAPAPPDRRAIIIDAPATVDYGTRKAELPEGALFGEWSCLYGTARSATVVASRPIYVVEMLRNILTFVLKDEGYRKQKREEYKQNVLGNHLSNLSFFADLTPAQLDEVRQGVELESFRDGQVIFDKGDPPDCMYIVSRGLVKVLLNDWPLLSPEDVRDWAALERLAKGDSGDAAQYLSAELRKKAGSAQRAWVLDGLNEGLKRRDFAVVKVGTRTEPAPAVKAIVESEAFKKAVAEDFPPKSEDWSDQDWRRYNRLVLEHALPGALRSVRRQVGPDKVRYAGSENILTYVTQGEFFGERGVALAEPRAATCVAYVHPRPETAELDPTGEKWRREEERVELVKIAAPLFKQLCQRHPSIKARVAEKIEEYKARSRERQAVRGWEDRAPVTQSDRFQQLGLVQGQKLMLIDLDRCTRCDECVQACVGTHDDGRTRLFLDGPRFGRYLVPTTCRSCRDPVCMIGCPVGSIRRGNNLEMVIEDWCIGCQLCAKNCPYGSIQMHDLGLIAEDSHGWSYQAASAVQGEAWTSPGFKCWGWPAGRTPFWWDDDLREELALSAAAPGAICFRRAFTLDAELADRKDGSFKLVIQTGAAEVKVAGAGKSARVAGFVGVWLNGQAIAPEQWRQEREAFVFEIAGDDRAMLHAGENVLAVRATPVAGQRAVLLQAAVDEVRPNGAVIPLKAVVCDQCSAQPGAGPACVQACPHDAAMRVDAWTGFPMR